MGRARIHSGRDGTARRRPRCHAVCRPPPRWARGREDAPAGPAGAAPADVTHSSCGHDTGGGNEGREHFSRGESPTSNTGSSRCPETETEGVLGHSNHSGDAGSLKHELQGKTRNLAIIAEPMISCRSWPALDKGPHPLVRSLGSRRSRLHLASCGRSKGPRRSTSTDRALIQLARREN